MTPKPSPDAAHIMGTYGSNHDEVERLLFEQYMKGRCWEIGNWDAGQKAYPDVHTRTLFAVWRDRAALGVANANTPTVVAIPPPGYKIVPERMTPEMHEAVVSAHQGFSYPQDNIAGSVARRVSEYVAAIKAAPPLTLLDGYRLQPIDEYEAQKQYVEATEKVLASAVEFVNTEKEKLEELRTYRGEPCGWGGYRDGTPIATIKRSRVEEWIADGDVEHIFPLYRRPLAHDMATGVTVEVEEGNVYITFKSRSGKEVKVRPSLLDPGGNGSFSMQCWVSDRINDANAVGHLSP
jgi:hypothetical protein